MSKTSLWYALLGFLLAANALPASAEQSTTPDFDSAVGGGHAQGTGLKIAFVDVRYLLMKSEKLQEADKQLHREFDAREKKLTGEKEEFTKSQEHLAKEAATMTEDEQKKVYKDLEKRFREIKEKEEHLRQEVNQRRNEELGKIQKTIDEEIKALVKEEHLDLVLIEGVGFASDAINMTEKVASRLEGGTPSSKAPKK